MVIAREMTFKVRLNFFEAGLLFKLSEQANLNRSDLIRDMIRAEAVRAGIIGYGAHISEQKQNEEKRSWLK